MCREGPAPPRLKSEDPRLLAPMLRDHSVHSPGNEMELKKRCQDLIDRQAILEKENQAPRVEIEALKDDKAVLEQETLKLENMLKALQEMQVELRKMRQGREGRQRRTACLAYTFPEGGAGARGQSLACSPAGLKT
jgi:hypothetical protein